MPNQSRRQRKKEEMTRWSTVVIWMMVIFLGSSVPLAALPKAPEFVPVIVHFCEYFILASLLIWAVNRGFKVPVSLSPVIAAFVVSVFYGALDELHQLYVPGRVTDMLDLTVDASGALLACLLVPLLVRLALRLRQN